jgi:hypothetical protein
MIEIERDEEWRHFRSRLYGFSDAQADAIADQIVSNLAARRARPIAEQEAEVQLYLERFSAALCLLLPPPLQ